MTRINSARSSLAGGHPAPGRPSCLSPDRRRPRPRPHPRDRRCGRDPWPGPAFPAPRQVLAWPLAVAPALPEPGAAPVSPSADRDPHDWAHRSAPSRQVPRRAAPAPAAARAVATARHGDHPRAAAVRAAPAVVSAVEAAAPVGFPRRPRVQSAFAAAQMSTAAVPPAASPEPRPADRGAPPAADRPPRVRVRPAPAAPGWTAAVRPRRNAEASVRRHGRVPPDPAAAAIPRRPGRVVNPSRAR